jgi:hypothetical protein
MRQKARTLFAGGEAIRETTISLPDLLTAPPTSGEMTEAIYNALLEHGCKQVSVPSWFPFGIATELKQKGARVIPQN